MPDFATFSDFKKRIASDRVEAHQETLRNGMTREGKGTGLAPGASPSDDAVAAEFERMRDFIARHYADATATHSFLDAAGNIIDCVPFDQQPAVVAARNAGWVLPDEPPPPALPEQSRDPGAFANTMEAGPQTEGLTPPLRRGGVDVYGNKVVCPSGSVPIRRITMDQLARLGTLDRFFRKVPPPLPKPKGDQPAPAAGGHAASPASTAPEFVASDGQEHRHAEAVLADALSPGVSYHGSSSFLNVWKPNPSPGVMSLSQQWVINQSSNGFMQTVEAGWQVSPTWGTLEPILFVFFTPSSYGAGSGYTTNADQHGFIVWKSASPGWVLGGAFGQVSTADGPQVGFQLQWKRDHSGNWWLFLGNTLGDLSPIGFFPAGLFNTTAGAGPLTQGANVVAFGGEVAFSGAEGGQMGSGVAPPGPPTPLLSAYQHVAFQYQVSVVRSVGGGLTPAALRWQDTGDNPPYGLQIGSDDPNWGSYFFFGGS